jgi:ElaB/YqjD/DUF883 family membrane-anchored ribosome-binding protein
MNDPKRQEIKDRIAAQARAGTTTSGRATRGNASASKAAPTEDENDLVAFAREHPLLTVAGGLAVGVLVAGLFPSARSAARKGGARAGALGAAGTQVAVGLFGQLLDSADDARRAGGEKLTVLGDTLGDTARSARRETRYLAERSSDNTRIAARDTTRALARSLHRLFG